jgi:hypothetical protein
LAVVAPGVLANDIDAEGQALSVRLVDGPIAGTVALHEDGSFVYDPPANFAGPDSFRYVAGDGPSEGNVATVRIDVRAVNDPPIGAPDTYTLAGRITLVVGAQGVLANDTDVDGPNLFAVVRTAPRNGVVVLAPNGWFVYVADRARPASDTFTYRPFDGIDFGAPVTVTLRGR